MVAPVLTHESPPGSKNDKNNLQHLCPLWSEMLENCLSCSLHLHYSFWYVPMKERYNQKKLPSLLREHRHILYLISHLEMRSNIWGFFRLFAQGPCWFDSFMKNHYFPSLPFLTRQIIFIWIYVPLIEKRVYSEV